MATKPSGSGTSKKTPARKPSKRRVPRKGIAFGFLLLLFLSVVGILVGYIGVIINGQRLLEANMNKTVMDEASIIYDRNGKEVSSLYKENREIAEPDEIPKKLYEAFVATEDRRFYEHPGIDLWAIGRALVKDIVARSAVEGGSTITQQLSKNMFLNADKTVFRKATEASISMALESRFTKEEILTMYLNRIYFANGVYGVKTAAKKYFGVADLKQLKLWQIATLAGIPKNPGAYNPISSPEKSKERRAVVLKLMAEQGLITEEERAAASNADYVPSNTGGKKNYLTYIDMVMDEANEAASLTDDDLLRGGYKIYTRMDANAQKTVETTFENASLFQKDMHNQKIQGSMVILDHKNGGIVAVVGGRDYVPKGYNRALSPRQPGSSFKPIAVYAPALESGKYSPYSQLEDQKNDFNGYSPRNYDDTYRGKATMLESIRKSLNQPAVWLLNQMGVTKGIDFAKKAGIPLEPQDRNLAIALGGLTKGASPLQMAQAYSAFANQGLMYKAHTITHIVNREGKEVYRHKAEKPAVMMSAKTAWYMTLMLQDAVQNGTGVRAKMDRPVAGKTGSTGLDLKGLEKYDSNVWFVGYTPEWTAAVWMGFDQNVDKAGNRYYVTVGSGATAAIFKEVMTKALAGRKVVPFGKPDGVPDLVEPKVPEAVGDLAASYSKEEKGVKLTWTGKGEKLTYQVYRKASNEPDFKELLRSPTTEVRDITVAAGEKYQYYVVPFDSEQDLTGEKSNVVQIEVPKDGGLEPVVPARPGQPGGLIDPRTGKPVTPGTGTGGSQPGTGTGTSAGGTGTSTGNPGTGTGDSGGTQPSSGTGGTGTSAPSTGTSGSTSPSGTSIVPSPLVR